MKIHFYLRYGTRFGETLFVAFSDGHTLPLDYLNEEFWHGSAELEPEDGRLPGYSYRLHEENGDIKQESEPDRSLHFDGNKPASIAVFDYFNPVGQVENVFLTQPFREVFGVGSPPRPPRGGEGVAPPDLQKGAIENALISPPEPGEVPSILSSKTKESDALPPVGGPGGATHVFRVKAPLLKADEVPCLLGHGVALRNWDSAAPLLMSRNGEWWEARLDLSGENFPLGYKYGVWNARDQKFLGFEEGSNRLLLSPFHTGSAENQPLTICNDNYARFPWQAWRGAGVAIPVFSLRSQNSWGTGEFTDLHLLADWARSVGLKLIQLLPVNDTSATHTWLDSYPYSAISAFALHPLYLNVVEVAGKKHAALLKPFAKKTKDLNALEAVDYEAVMRTKWEAIRLLYAAQKADFQQDSNFKQYFSENRHWLASYAAFCYLRDKYGTAHFGEWPSYGVYWEKEIEKLVSPKAAHYDEVAVHYFVQWHLHRQLKAAADYAHAQGLALKGDIPIGIYRYSCDAWVAPELYNMDMQAGAPPDDFAEKGQNWGFPTYNWERMKADGFAWWQQRFRQMSLYFDAFRIDHILGFFRIWSIPMGAVEGILGHFVPAVPVLEQEFHDAGIGFNAERFCKPYISVHVLRDLFEEELNWVGENCLLPRKDELFDLRPEFATQRQVEKYFENLPATEENIRIRNGLNDLIANVILLDVTPEGQPEKQYAFRFDADKTSSFQDLPEEVKQPLKDLYINYFYRRQDDFWQKEAMEKLPALKRSTNMLVCGEDLGMVPHCVPDVMRELGILSLEVQRMPKTTGHAFFHPKNAPYLAVVTPSTHDMSTIRGWWEEDRDLSQRFFNEILGYEGTAPFFCESWLNRAILRQHFQSPAMWSVFQLQDLFGMDEKLRRENPHDERINVPANPKNYWRYRMHIALDDLMKAEGFNTELRKMMRDSNRI